MKKAKNLAIHERDKHSVKDKRNI